MVNTLMERTSSRTLPTLLSVDDRCDGCGSQAYGLTSDGLLWCGHHLTQHAAALASAGVVIQIDRRDRIDRGRG